MAEHSAPGQHCRKGITLRDAVHRFGAPEQAEAWFVAQRWPNGAAGPRCQSADIQERARRKPQPYPCRSCRKDFSVKTGSLLHSSKLPLSSGSR